MDQLKIRVDGIYDFPTLKCLQDLNYQDFCFDFRPLSLNFFQQHRFLELLESSHGAKGRFFLHYAHEPEFVIEKMLNDLRHHSSTFGDLSSFYLEFSDERSAQFYDQFGLPFFWHFSPHGEYQKILQAKNLRGLVIPFSLLEEATGVGGPHLYLQQIWELAQKLGKGNIQLGLQINWNSHILESLFDFFKFSFLAVPINSQMELSYRQVDLSKLKGQLHLIRGQYCP